MSRAALVLNPVKVSDPDGLVRLLTQRGGLVGWQEPLVTRTSQRDPGAGVARAAVEAGVDVVLAAGGDGTVRAVAEGLAFSGVPLGVLPMGTGNLLARNLSLPTDATEAIDCALSGPRRCIDLGRVGGEGGGVFAIMAGTGFDAATMRDTPERLKGVVGWPAYLVGGVRALRRGRIDVQISLDGGPPRPQRVRTVLIANLGGLQAGVQLLPQARPDDGVLDVCVIAPRGVADALVVLGRALRGRQHSDARMHVHRACQVVVRAKRPQPRQLDGEAIADGAELTVEVLTGALMVCVPKEDWS